MPVREGAPLSLRRLACLEWRSRYAQCGNCTRACPQGALRFNAGRLELSAECLGCGRCVAACPTGALEAPGFRLRVRPDAVRNRPVTLDCWMVQDTGGPAIRVPCLGGLPISRILGLRLQAGAREVHFLDRGWCEHCPAAKGAHEHPLLKSLERARARMRDAGVPEPLLPQLVQAPLPLHRMSDELGPRRAARRSARRGFFARIAPTQAFAEALSAVGREYPAQARAPQAASAERAAVLEMLETLARCYGGSVSQRLFHTVELGAGCDGGALCAATCPTGALQMDERAHGAVLSHDARLCIGCAHCERICPHGALSVRYGEGEPAAPRAVGRFALHTCTSCGQTFRARPGTRVEDACCEHCAKSQHLARSAFEQLYRSGAQTRA